MPPSPPSAFPLRRFKTAALALAAGLSAAAVSACGYPDSDLTPPDRPAAPAAAPAPAEGANAGFGLGAPFVVIRFGPEPVDYEEPLAQAVGEALAQRPEARFHLLALTAGGGPELPRQAPLGHAEAVLRSLAALGVPPDQVFLAAAHAPDRLIDEVRIYLR